MQLQREKAMQECMAFCDVSVLHLSDLFSPGYCAMYSLFYFAAVSVFVSAWASCFGSAFSSSETADLNSRTLLPSDLPTSGSLPGPKTSRPIPRISRSFGIFHLSTASDGFISLSLIISRIIIYGKYGIPIGCIANIYAVTPQGMRRCGRWPPRGSSPPCRSS